MFVPGLSRFGRHLSQVTVSQARLQEFIRAELSYFAAQHTQALSLEQIVDASTPGKVARLVHKEIPFRFAARIRHIEAVEGWEKQEELRQLHKIFLDSFSELRLTEPPGTEECSLTVSDLTEYTEVIRSVRKRHMPVVALLAEAIRKMNHKDAWMEGDAFQSWADTFLVSRISTEMLTSHYMAVVDWHDSASEASELLGSDHIGIVDTKCNPGRICEQAAKAVQSMYANATEQVADKLQVEVHSHSDSGSEDSTIAFSYIPKYLFYIVQELIKNSARATVEACKLDGRRRLPDRPIIVTVCADQKQIAIRIADQGGGISCGKSEEIWSYLFSTSMQPFQEYLESGSPLAGWGVGLPLGRLYARYLGGSLQLMNVPGTGVDAYLFLRRIDPSSAEGVPRASISDSVAPV
ncbi:unnamed protein product [Effrenium voratum]|uniref:Protein-serine/threonine kinase n=1 Tax=Effrenium voratum TaxID=2562239 RepID=A0AA36JAS6_9DINO|nr:unnamed protein product [Effrenium voratum]CAJ1447602.1 unnamed protein product [Effrenium voratum]